MKIKYKTGSVREVSKVIGMRLVAAGIADIVADDKIAPTYQTRMMQAEPITQTVNMFIDPVPAPYGYKADGTPRKRPGRPASVE